MTSLDELVSRIQQACDEAHQIDQPLAWVEKLREANRLAREIAVAGGDAAPEAAESALDRMIHGLSAEEPQLASEVAFVVGIFIERGVQLRDGGAELLAKYTDTLALAAAFVDRVEREFPPSAGEEDELAYSVGDRRVTADAAQRYWVEQRDLPQAYAAVDRWSLPVVSLLSRDAAARELARGDGRLVRLTRRLHAHGTSFVRMLLELLENEPLLVLYPETRQGFLLRVSGITDNCQLHTLLADALVGAAARAGERRPRRPLPGGRPPAEIAAAMRGDAPPFHDAPSHAVWDLFQWSAVGDEGTLAAAPREAQRISDEGIPADIDSFDGVRTLLLGPASAERSWGTARNIGHLRASVEIEHELDESEVVSLLRNMSAPLVS